MRVVYIDDIEHETYVDQGNYLAEYAINIPREQLFPVLRTVIFLQMKQGFQTQSKK